MSQHIFILTFNDLGIVVLRVDLSKRPPTIEQMSRDVTEEQCDEYVRWLNRTVTPQIATLCKPARAKKGLEVLS